MTFGIGHDARSSARRGAVSVSAGQIVAQLTFVFWKRLYSEEYEQTLWRTALKRVFPDKTLKRGSVGIHLERLHQTRNRIAHHESVYGRRLQDTLAAIGFVLEKFGMPGAAGVTPLGKLLADQRVMVGQHADELERRLDELRMPGGSVEGASGPSG